MKHTDNILPYILASMHPMIHMAMLVSSGILRATDSEQFFKVPKEDQCTADPIKSKAGQFIGGEKVHLVNMIQLAHFVAIICHYLSGFMSKQGMKTLGGVFMVIKIFSYLYCHFTLQTAIIFQECRDDMVDQSQVMAWLSYEVVAFYLNIVAMSVFLLFSSLKKFYSFRDRLGFATDNRKTQDFLNYCKEDIHWFQAWFTMLMLCVMAVVMRTKSHEGLGLSGGVLFFRHILEVLLLGALGLFTEVVSSACL